MPSSRRRTGRRRYGQHYLADASFVRRIVEASEVGKADSVLEIGPGRGILTRALAEAAARVLAVEVDRRLFAGLEASGLPPNVSLKLGDVLETPNAEISAALGNGYRLISNLPYEITSATLEKFLPDVSGPRSLTLMIQKEVGERIVAGPGKIGRLTLFCGYYADSRIAFGVPPGAFSPPPSVGSCIIHMRRRQPPLSGESEMRFFRLIEAAFSARRRNLKNALAGVLGKEAENRLISAKIDPVSRPEEIPLERWITLASGI